MLLPSTVGADRPFLSGKRGEYSHLWCAYTALEGFTETLKDKLNPTWNIKISSILCGGFVTDFLSSLKPHCPQHPAYADGSKTVERVRKMLVGTTVENQKQRGFGDPTKGVQKIYELSKLPNPPLGQVGWCVAQRHQECE
ncbi:hypothetical protein LXA43DRAFT_122915 [Ganoderma leucocontextum]|nr:hypothetical protein LXA43DRAFT_122915 [Ganoderma leucocontextum]